MLRTKLLILLTVFIDIIGIGIVIPILPFYVERFSSSPMVITSLFAVFALCSFFSAPVIGALSDRVGRRPMLIVSIFSTAIGWFVFAAAPNILFLFIGRIIDGIMAGNFPIAQSYLSDISRDDKERTANLGLIGAAHGIGFIVGPLLGGLLGQLGHTVPFWFVGGLALGNAILSFFTLPETHEKRSGGKIHINPFVPLVRAFRDTTIRANYGAWFFFGLAMANFHSVFALYIRDVFHFTEAIAGVLIASMGVVIAFNQGFAMKHIWLRHFKEPTLELGMLVVFAVGFLLLAGNTLPFFAAALLCITFGQSVLRVVMTSQVVGFTGKDKRGEVLGIMSSISSFSMTIGPFIAGVLYLIASYVPFVIGAAYTGAAFILLYRRRRALAREILPVGEDTYGSSIF